MGASGKRPGKVVTNVTSLKVTDVNGVATVINLGGVTGPIEVTVEIVVIAAASAMTHVAT